MSLRATLYLTDQEAHNTLIEGRVDDFFSYIYTDADRPQWVDKAPLDLDKSWHVIHFLVTGDKSTTLLLGGHQIPIIEEHSESHSPSSISNVFHQINGRLASEILDGYSLEKLNEAGIYDSRWDERARPYLLEKFSGFIDKVATAVGENRGLFISIT